jgi:hypothetical protein
MEEHTEALTIAIKNNFPENIIRYIYQQLGPPFDINSLWPSFFTSNNQMPIIILLKLGANINYQMPETGSTSIMYAAQKKCTEVVLTLLEHGADLTIKNNSGGDVYFFSEQSGITDVIKDFIAKKEKEELEKKNKMLEQQCFEMNNKLNYLMEMVGKMNIGQTEDMLHKKSKALE